MKFYLMLFVTVITGLLAQLLFMQYASVYGAAPQVMLVCVIFMALRYGPLFGEIFGFAAGLVLDTFMLSVFGVNSMVFTVTGFVYGSLSGKINEQKLGVQLLLAFAASCLLAGMLWFTSAVFSHDRAYGARALMAIPVYTTLLSPVLIILYRIWIVLVEKWSGTANRA